ncbi:glycosyltransferase [Deinococcus sp.]|uniref:glycosyltransferase n=1 Tax=Deinococcus sp. TaxID=47478 RepID=UPI003B58E4D9
MRDTVRPAAQIEQTLSAAWPLVIAVPARNEACRIARTLAALGQQIGETPESCRIIVLANNCTDDTAARACLAAQTLAFKVDVIEVDFPPQTAHVGRARGHALALAAESLAQHPEAILATTDADTLVAPNWAQRTRLALASADAVGGRILTLPEERRALPPALRRLQLQDTAYHLLASQLLCQLDPDPFDQWPRHHQHFGASLALRLSAWRQLSAWPEVRCLEDVALIEALTRLDLRVRHCPEVKVWTSARMSRRVEVGLSSQLREWQGLQGGGKDWRVPGAAELDASGRARYALRRAWNGRKTCSYRSLEQLWMVGAGELNAALGKPTFGLALEAATLARHQAGVWALHFPAVAIEQALSDLRARLTPFPSELETVLA